MFILASSSPRRQQMLLDLGVSFEVVSPQIDESPQKKESPKSYVTRLAYEKASAARAQAAHKLSNGDWFVLAADTIVVSSGKILGKPKDRSEAVSMGKKLSGKKHQVLTAYCWLGRVNGKERKVVGCLATNVKFAKRSAEFWRWYSETGEPLDKAGAYAAQGIGVSFIESIDGSYSNVVGLPLAQVIDSFRKTFGLKVFGRIFPWS